MKQCQNLHVNVVFNIFYLFFLYTEKAEKNWGIMGICALGKYCLCIIMV